MVNVSFPSEKSERAASEPLQNSGFSYRLEKKNYEKKNYKKKIEKKLTTL